jgi:hypothetical protein
MIDLEQKQMTETLNEIKIRYYPDLTVPLPAQKVDVHVYRSLPPEEVEKLGLKRIEADWFADYL